jgi:hypothetical protein
MDERALTSVPRPVTGPPYMTVRRRWTGCGGRGRLARASGASPAPLPLDTEETLSCESEAQAKHLKPARHSAPMCAVDDLPEAGRRTAAGDGRDRTGVDIPTRPDPRPLEATPAGPGMAGQRGLGRTPRPGTSPVRRHAALKLATGLCRHEANCGRPPELGWPDLLSGGRCKGGLGCEEGSCHAYHLIARLRSCIQRLKYGWSGAARNGNSSVTSTRTKYGSVAPVCLLW